jgi:hypothetical protein
MTLEELLTMWSKDAKIDAMDLGDQSLASARLHAKYLTLLMRAKKARISQFSKVKEYRRDAWLYYTGKAEAAKYAEKPFELRLLKGETVPFVEADADLRREEEKLELLDMTINSIESIMWEISRRKDHVKNALEFQKFVAGG